MSLQDSESRRFDWTFGWVFLRPILAKDRPKNDFVRGFRKVLFFFFEDLSSYQAVQKSFGGYLWNSSFLWKHRFHCHRSKSKHYVVVSSYKTWVHFFFVSSEKDLMKFASRYYTDFTIVLTLDGNVKMRFLLFREYLVYVYSFTFPVYCCTPSMAGTSRKYYFIKSWKTSAVSTTVWMVETQLCELRGTSDAFV